MKAFYTNPYFKKWALTGCLVAALGFSVSHNKHFAGFAAIDMASTETPIETKLSTKKGVIPVRYLKKADGKITALVSVLDAEGKVCTTCDEKIVTLSGNFEENTKDIAELNVRLLQKLDEDKKEVSKIADKKEVRKDDDDDAPAVQDLTDTKLSKIVDQCSKRKDKADRLDCESSAFMALLQKYENVKDKNKALDNNKLKSFFISHVERPLIDQVSDSRRVASLLRKGIELGPNDMDKNPQEMREAVLEKIKTMIGDVPSNFEFIRRRLMTAETNMTTIEAKETQEIYRQARAQNSPALNNEALLRTQDLQGLLNGIQSTNYEGLRTAMTLDGANVQTLDQYYNQFNAYARNLSQAIAQNPYDFQIPTTSFDNPATIVNSINNPNGGATKVIILTDATDANGNRVGRTGGIFTGTQQAVQIPTAQSNSGVIMFTQPQPITQQQREARDKMRAVK